MIKPTRVICPICKEEFSYGFLKYGLGHLCKRNADNINDYLDKLVKKTQ
jgi:hypothetical protein